MSKVAKQFRLEEELVKEISSYAVSNNITETKAVIDAWNYFYNDSNDKTEKLVSMIIDRLDKNFGNILRNIRFGVRDAEENVQVLIEILNTLMMCEDIKKVVPTSYVESPVVIGAKQEVEKRIEAAKQRKDYKRKE